MGTSAGPPPMAAVLNLARFHREHEKFYASASRERAVVLQRHARALHALADRWAVATPSKEPPLGPYAGADDLNDPVALQLDGILFMEGEGRPAELTALLRDLRTAAEDHASTGGWLAAAMRASWDVAAGLAAVPGLEDLLGERHRIVANDWLAADMSTLIAAQLLRAAEIVDGVDLSPAGLRADLAGPRRAVGLLRSAAEIVNWAADLCSASASLVNDNERRWRVFRLRVTRLVEDVPTS